MDELDLEVPVDLGAQPAHMGLDHGGPGVEVEVPDMLEQHGPRHHPAGVAQQILQQAELARLQVDRPALPGHRPLQQVHLEIAHPQHGLRGGHGRAAAERVHAGRQLGEGEGLHEIVVAAGIEAGHAIVEAAERAEE